MGITRAVAGRALACAAAAVVAGGFSATAARAAAPYVYVGNETSRTVSQFGTNFGSGTLSPLPAAAPATDAYPHAIAISPDVSSVYVANRDGNTISHYVVGPDGALTPGSPATVVVPWSPEDLTLSPSGDMLYVVDNNELRRYAVGPDGDLTAVGAPVATGAFPARVVVSPNGRHLYVINFSGQDVWQYDVAADGTPVFAAKVALGAAPQDLVMSPDGTSLYVATRAGVNSVLHQFDVAPDGGLSAKDPATVTGDFDHLEMAPDGHKLFSSNVAVIFTNSVAGDGTVTVGAAKPTGSDDLAGIAVSPDGDSLYGVTIGNYVLQFDVTAGGLAFKTPPYVANPAGSSLPRSIAITPQADLALTQAVAPQPGSDGEEIVVTLTATNQLGTPATGVEVSTTMPADLNLVSATSADGACTEGATVTCDLGTLAQGSSKTVRVRARAVRAGTVTTSATVSALQPDPNPADNTATGGATVAPRPGATTVPATDVGTTGATLNGVVVPAGTGTRYRFEYGTTTAYGAWAPAAATDAGPGTAGRLVSAAVSGLAAGTTYHFRLVVTNDGGATVSGDDRTFTTATPPPAEEPPVDRTPPAISKVVLAAKSLRLRLSEPGTARATIAVRRTRTVRNGGKTRRETRWVTVRTVRMTVKRGGAVTARIGKRMAPGRYRVAIRATDAAGNTGGLSVERRLSGSRHK